MIMGNRRYGARFGTAVANVGDLNMDGYEGESWSRTIQHDTGCCSNLSFYIYLPTVKCESYVGFSYVSAVS
jgi:hypothetical protein